MSAQKNIQDLFPPDVPLKFDSCRVWRTYMGGRLIDAFHGNEEGEDTHFPEDWIGSTVRANNLGRESVIEGYTMIRSSFDPDTTISLKALLEFDAAGYLGASHVLRFGKEPGVLVKLLDSALRLPIQAHPSKETSKKVFHSDYGKTESWYVLATREIEGECPYVLLGFRDGITKEIWRRIYDEQDIPAMLDALHKIPVQPGDVLFVKHGVPHGIGPGCFLCEVQEPSDLVYRTELVSPTGAILNERIVTMGFGVDAMMEEFDYDGASLMDTLGRFKVSPVVLETSTGGDVLELLGNSVTDCFSIRQIRLSPRHHIDYLPSGFCMVIVEKGTCDLQFEKGSLPVSKGDALFLPVGLPGLRWKNDGDEAFSAILCLPPKA